MSYMPLRVRAKFFLKRYLPDGLFLQVLSVWRKTGNKFVKYPSFPETYQKQFIERFGMEVTGGPFAGMKYIDQSTGSSYITKLIGSYEEVLHGVIEDLKARDYKTIIDIGCAEGYYLVGLGIYNKHATLIGYDIEEKALSLTRTLYKENNLSNPLFLVKDCTYADLANRVTENSLIVCDSEGFEAYILDPEKCPALQEVQTVLIELHDFAYPGIKQILTRRFSPSHTVSTMTFRHADPENYPFLKSMANKLHRFNILYERAEQAQEWLLLEKR